MSRECCWGSITPSLHVLVWFPSQLSLFTVSDRLWLSSSSQETQYACSVSECVSSDLQRSEEEGNRCKVGGGLVV